MMYRRFHAHLWAVLAFSAILTLTSKLIAEEAPAAPSAQSTQAQTATPEPEGASKDAPATLLPVTVSDTIVTTPARLPVAIKKTGVSVTVIDGKENSEVHQNTELGESLRQTPGLNVSKSGYNSDFTTMFTRGGNSNQTLFMYDGFKVNRQGGNFNLGPVDPVQLGRIEVARGPSSSLYGTDAVTGTVNIISAKGEGRPDLTTSVAGGSYGTDRETVQIEGSEKKFSYNVSSSRYNRESVGYDNSWATNYNYAARLDYDINDCHSLKMVVRGLDSSKGFYEDSGSGYGPAADTVDPNDRVQEHDILAGIEYKGRILPIWELTARAGVYALNYNTISIAPNPPSKFGGFPQTAGRTDVKERRPQFGLQNDVIAFQDECGDIKDIITFGGDFEDDKFDQHDTQFGANIKRSRHNYSIYAQDRLELFERVFVTGGIRREENQQFGDFITARGDASILIPESDSRVHGSVGNAFRAPSFYEFFSAFGNPALTPEENIAYDAGFEQNLWCNKIKLDATYFHNSFHDLINFNQAFKFENLKNANTSGFELSGEVKPIEKLTFRATSTLLHTEDNLSRQLLRRPNLTSTAQAIVHPICGLDLSVDFLHEGKRSDVGPTPNNSFARVNNKPYSRVDLAASYRFLCHWRAFSRVENLTNTQYEEVKTFRSPGVNFLAGMEFNWKF